MNAVSTIIFWLILYLYFPVLDIAGHRIFLPEFYTYVAYLFNIKTIRKTGLIIPFVLYALGFTFTILITSILDGTLINNHDIWILRNIVQFVMLLYLFETKFHLVSQDLSKKQFEQFFFKCILILSFPALIIWLQRFDLLGMRSLTIQLYKPAFFFLDANSFSEYRYTSIFKDFFTEAVYFIILMSVSFYFLLKTQLQFWFKFILIFLLLFVYSSQLFVSRTSLMFTPVVLAFVLIFISNLNLSQILRHVFIMLAIAIPLSLIGAKIILGTKIVNLEWALEGFNFLGSNIDNNPSTVKTFSSYNTMNSWMLNFFDYLKNNPLSLFIPHHDYDLTEVSNPYLYTDSFYGQEIYRYGIYGMISYFLFVLFLVKAFWSRAKMGILIVVLLVLLNYKGGNVFFMDKNIYFYAFVFSFLMTYESFYLKRFK